MTKAEQVTTSPADALERLYQGNDRFVSGHRLTRDWPAQVHGTAHGQHPFARFRHGKRNHQTGSSLSSQARGRS